MYQHAGGEVTSRVHGNEYIVTGGIGPDDLVNTKTYLYSLKNKIWREGPDFPYNKDIAFDRVRFPVGNIYLPLYCEDSKAGFLIT